MTKNEMCLSTKDFLLKLMLLENVIIPTVIQLAYVTIVLPIASISQNSTLAIGAYKYMGFFFSLFGDIIVRQVISKGTI